MDNFCLNVVLYDFNIILILRFVYICKTHVTRIVYVQFILGSGKKNILKKIFDRSD